jgi:glycosyltransferase involved in cell wall biosynthesis
VATVVFCGGENYIYGRGSGRASAAEKQTERLLRMKIYAICLVKNEDDVIGQTLVYATRYCDKIFVIDNGSTDRTWEIVQSLVQQYPQIVPFVQTLERYDDGLRWLVYDAHHQELTDQDWWMILDGDEFLAEDPRPVIQKAMKKHADVIDADQIQFYYTDKDYEAWQAGQDNREQPIYLRRRYYRIDHREARFFRNLSTGTWETSFLRRKLPMPPWLRSKAPVDPRQALPSRIGKKLRQRILNRHYQYRDPEQIEKRLKLRFGNPLFAAQVKSQAWQSVMRLSTNLYYYRDGDPWRFNISDKISEYTGAIRYQLKNRLLHLLGWWAGDKNDKRSK